MSEGKSPIPVRMDQSLVARVRRAAKRLGTSSSAILRLSILTQLPKIESGILELPGCDEEMSRQVNPTGRRRRIVAASVTIAALIAFIAFSAHAPGCDDDGQIMLPVASCAD